jgi:putative tricarboxylic transport membrane protein
MSRKPTAKPQAQPDRAAFAVAAVLVILAGVIAWNAAHLNAGVAHYSRIGASAFPYGVAALLLAAALGTAVAAARGEFPDREPLDLHRGGWILAGLIAQTALLNVAGFSIATGFLFAFTARGFGGKPLWLTLPFGIAFAFVLYAIFYKGLQLSLPAGPLERLI